MDSRGISHCKTGQIWGTRHSLEVRYRQPSLAGRGKIGNL